MSDPASGEDRRTPPGANSGRATSLSLIEQAKAADPDAWRRLVALYTPSLRYWCRRWGVGNQDADDVLQEVFEVVALKLKDFRRDREGDTFRGWLRGIARHKVLNLIQGRAPRGKGGTGFYQRLLQIPDPAPPAGEDTSDPDEIALVEDLYQQALRLVRAEFEDHTWRAFWRTAVDGQPPGSIAQELGMTAAAVRKAKSRVLRRLKDALGEPPR